MTDSSSSNTPTSAFAKHKSAQNAADTSNTSSGSAKMPWVARFLIFAFVPSFTGLCGLGISYLQQVQGIEDDDGQPHTVNFDRDFVTPFLLALAFVVVIGFQTGGFSSSERKGAFSWPKTRKIQRVRHERVIVDDDVDKKEQ